ncbi:MAG: guanylate kinase [Candidatus Lariskella arthropodorum]
MPRIKRRGLIFLLSAPSGAGKTTLAKKLLECDKHLHLSISITTRKMRAGEQHGVDYYFTDIDNFRKMIEAGEFLEYAEVFGELYGTPRSAVEDYLSRGEDVLFEVDWQGHRSLIATARNDVSSVFILPPSREELLSRLNKRNDGEEMVKYRMAMADTEMSHWNEYDYTIINRNIEYSVDKLYAILRAERLKKERRLGLAKFVGGLLSKPEV